MKLSNPMDILEICVMSLLLCVENKQKRTEFANIYMVLIVRWGKILANLANRPPFNNILPTNTLLPTLLLNPNLPNISPPILEVKPIHQHFPP